MHSNEEVTRKPRNAWEALELIDHSLVMELYTLNAALRIAKTAAEHEAEKCPDDEGQSEAMLLYLEDCSSRFHKIIGHLSSRLESITL